MFSKAKFQFVTVQLKVIPSKPSNVNTRSGQVLNQVNGTTLYLSKNFSDSWNKPVFYAGFVPLGTEVAVSVDTNKHVTLADLLN